MYITLSKVVHLENFCLLKFLKFFVCNPCQSSPSLTVLVPLWFIIISLMFLLYFIYFLICSVTVWKLNDDLFASTKPYNANATGNVSTCSSTFVRACQKKTHNSTFLYTVAVFFPVIFISLTSSFFFSFSFLNVCFNSNEAESCWCIINQFDEFYNWTRTASIETLSFDCFSFSASTLFCFPLLGGPIILRW